MSREPVTVLLAVTIHPKPDTRWDDLPDFGGRVVRDNVDDPDGASVVAVQDDDVARDVLDLIRGEQHDGDLLWTVDTVTPATLAGTVRTEWAAALRANTGTQYQGEGDDQAHATLVADSVATYLASLNEPTRRHLGVTGVDLVTRRVHTLPDNTVTMTPWTVVRPGRPVDGDQ